ncbi:hypothetical protein [Klebsiella pasteurii]|uniref:hypothetical protein n=1 Tax=Klebsiella pasteurii TaxID=2587529 RepID=UPI00292E1988|nr:hypothetical protein [Klebsiella pasteurii]
MISTDDKIYLGLSLIGFALIFGSVILAALNRKRFDKICVLYKEKHGCLPEALTTFYDSDKNMVNTLYFNYGYNVKMQFIFMPLIRNKNSLHMRNVDKDFIRGLPKQLTVPFYLEFYLTILGAFLILAAFVLMKVEG